MALERSDSSYLKTYVLVLCAIGLALSVVALYEHVIFTHGLATGPSFCNLSAHLNCEKVNASKWSSFFGVPVASYGIFLYLLLGTAAILGSRDHARSFAGFSLVSTTVATAGSLTLFAISEFVIGALCLVCIGTYLVNILLLVATLGGAFKWRVPDALRSGAASAKDLLRGIPGLGTPGDIYYSRALTATALIAFGLATASPRIILSFSRPEPKSYPNVTPMDPVAMWQKAPVVVIPGGLATGLMGDHAKGDATAPIQLVEFADFECFGCRRMYQDLKPLLARYADKVSIIFRHYPLDNSCNPGIDREFHRYACLASQFSRCAGEQGRFWESVDYLFTFEGLESKRPLPDVRQELLSAGSSALGLDGEAIRACVDSGRHIEKIHSDIGLGNQFKIMGTPSIFVNGRPVARPSAVSLQKIFDSILGVAPPQGTPVP